MRRTSLRRSTIGCKFYQMSKHFKFHQMSKRFPRSTPIEFSSSNQWIHAFCPQSVPEQPPVALLNESRLELVRAGRILVCTWHGWQFDIVNGRAVHEDRIRLLEHRVRVEDGDAIVTLWAGSWPIDVPTGFGPPVARPRDPIDGSSPIQGDLGRPIEVLHSNTIPSIIEATT